MNIAIRVDGGKNIGMGHIMRCIVLAKELKKKNEVFFLCRYDKCKSEEYIIGINKIESEGFTVIKISCDDTINDIILVQKKFNIDILITDSYDVDEFYFDKLKEYFLFTGYIDDINICRLNVDFIINQNINAKYIKYNTDPNKNTKLFLGPKYCLLREEFKCNINKKIKNEVENILLTVGGSDKKYDTLKILKVLIKTGKVINVVIGNAFDKELIKLIKLISNNNVNLYENANMSQLMQEADLAISACGSTVYELAAMQVPTIGVIIADNQIGICDKMDELGLIVSVREKNSYSIKKLEYEINNLIYNKNKRIELVENQKKVINENSVHELINRIEKLINK